LIYALLLFAGGMSCPVLTTPSVRGAMGEVTVTRVAKEAGYECQFKSAEIELMVAVSKLAGPERFGKLADDECAGGRDVAKLKAIGNEARACSSGTNGAMAEKVVGRVRNQAFVIRLTSSDKLASAKDLRSKVTGLAEQVAGNLF
jgi:hypothetical protein